MVELKVSKKSQNGFWAQLRRLPRAWVGATLVGIVLLGAILAPIISPADPIKQFRDGLAPNGTPLPPDARFLLGTDHLGRDILSRMLYGAQISLTVSFVANLVAAAFGTLVGMLAGYYSGTIDYL